MFYEVYTPQNKMRNKNPFVTFSNKVMFLNIDTINLLNAEYIEMAYDRGSKTLRLNPSNKGIPIKNRRIYIGGFLKCFDLDPSKIKGKYYISRDLNNNSLYVHL